MESNHDIARIRFVVNEKDFGHEMDVIIAKTLSGLKPAAQVHLTISLLLVVLLLAVTGWQRHLVMIVILLLLTVLVIAWKVIFGFLLRKSSEKTVKVKRQAGEFDAPMEAVFYPDRLSITGADTHSVFPWNEITGAYETAEGLYLVEHRNRYLYFPARFFDQDTAFAVTSFLTQALGKKFQRETLMNLPGVPEVPGETAQPVTEESEPKYQFDYAMTGKDVSAVAGRSGRIILTVFGLLIAAVCGLMAWRFLQRGNTYSAVFTLIICLAVIVVFVCTYLKNVGAGNYPTKQVNLQWYDDHVTTVTHQEDAGFHRVPYVKLKQIRRQGHLTVITFKDNTFLYVPQSAFSDEGQRINFETFLKEKCVEYSK